MAFLNIGGVEVNAQDSPAPSAQHSRTPPIRTHTGHVARQAGHRSFFNRSIVVGPYPESEREIMKLFLDGVGESWRFVDASPIGSCGSVPGPGGTYTILGTGGQFSGRVTVGSGSYIELPSKISTTDGWSIDLWREEVTGTPYQHLVVYGTGTNMASASVLVSIDGATPVVASTINVGNWLSVASDGDVRLQGFDDVGGPTATAVAYCEIHIRPFTLFAAVATGLAGETLEPYSLPTYRVSGTILGEVKPGTARTVKAEVSVEGAEYILLGGNVNDRIPIQIFETR